MRAPRQPLALVAKARKAGPMHDRRAERGGAKNEMAELMEETEPSEEIEMKIGDVVRLKSGGPAMTVEDVDGVDGAGSLQRILCVWFNSQNEVCRQTFDPAALRQEPLR